MLGYKKIGSLFILLIFAITFLACNKKKETHSIFAEPASEKLDATCTWLKKDENTIDANYNKVFYNYYNQKIKEKNFLLAAKAMEVVAWNKGNYQIFEPHFLRAITFFDQHYSNKIPPLKSTFIATYLGEHYTDKGMAKKAIAYYTKNTLFEVNDYESCYVKADALRSIAWSYYTIGRQDLAVEYNLKSLDYFKKSNQNKEIGAVYMNMGSIYNTSNNSKEAEKYYNKALSYFAKQKKPYLRNIYLCLYNKIEMYSLSKDYTKRNPLIDSTFTAFKKTSIDDTSVKVSIYGSKIRKLIENDSLKEAKTLLDELKPEIITLNSSLISGEFEVYETFYDIEKNKGLRDTKKILKSISFSLENQNFAQARDFYIVLIEDAKVKKDFKKAFFYQEELDKTVQKIGDEEMENKIVELNTKYQTEKKEQEIVLQKKTINNNNKTIGLLISGIIGFLLIIIAFSLVRKQKRLKQEKQNAQQYTKQLLEKTEEERKRIASDLHDSVSHELLSLKNSFEEKSEITNTKIDSIINDIRIISRNLHPIMFDKIGLKSSIEQLVERAQLVNDFMVTSDIDYKQVLSSSDELQIYRIIQEALSNIIKYANAIAAKITISETNNSLLIEIKDNGIGFNIDETLNGKNAFGLHNIIERSRAIGGEAKITSDKKGTIITIEIKKP